MPELQPFTFHVGSYKLTGPGPGGHGGLHKLTGGHRGHGGGGGGHTSPRPGDRVTLMYVLPMNYCFQESEESD